MWLSDLKQLSGPSDNDADVSLYLELKKSCVAGINQDVFLSSQSVIYVCEIVFYKSCIYFCSVNC